MATFQFMKGNMLNCEGGCRPFCRVVEAALSQRSPVAGNLIEDASNRVFQLVVPATPISSFRFAGVARGHRHYEG